jgi:hypothetical protein
MKAVVHTRYGNPEVTTSLKPGPSNCPDPDLGVGCPVAATG